MVMDITARKQPRRSYVGCTTSCNAGWRNARPNWPMPLPQPLAARSGWDARVEKRGEENRPNGTLACVHTAKKTGLRFAFITSQTTLKAMNETPLDARFTENTRWHVRLSPSRHQPTRAQCRYDPGCLSADLIPHCPVSMDTVTPDYPRAKITES